MMWHKKKTVWQQTRRVIGKLLGDMNRGNTMTLAAGIAYFAALAFFPSFAAMFAIATIVISPEQAAGIIREINVYLPSDIAGLVGAQLDMQDEASNSNILFAIVAIAVALFGASAATENMLRSLNVAYGTTETRNPIKLRVLSIIVLICALLVALVVALLLIVDEYMISWGVPGELVTLVAIIRWPLLLVIMSAAFALVYRYGPDRPRAKWRWVSWGAMLATALWLLATLGLFLYTRYSSGFGASYALFAGIVVLMVWFNLSAMALLIGAHVNHRQEIGYKK